MAITWGSQVSSGTNAMRLGWELTRSPSTVTASTSSVKITLKLYFATKYPVYYNGASFSISGHFSGSGSFNISHGSSSAWSSSNQTLIATKSITVTPSYSGTLTRSFSASATIGGVIPGTARASGSTTVPRRPISAPAAPTGAGVTRNSNTQMTVSWTNTSPTSASRPYQKVRVQRWDAKGGAYKTIATLTGRPTSYVDKSTGSNNRYRYRVRAENTAGTSSYVYTSYIVTTPAAPGAPKATKKSNGDITLSWSLSGVTYNTGVEVWVTEGGVDKTTRQTLLPAGTTSWTHTSPNTTKTWQYRVRAVASSPTLYSSYSARSNTVQLLTNPLAPTRLAPANEVLDATQDHVLTWQHNEVDGTEQRMFDLWHRAVGTTTWSSTGYITSDISEWTLPADTYENGQEFEWQVRTWGLFTSPGPFSAAAINTFSTPPSATITAPEDGAVIDVSRIGAAWDFFDPEDNPQSGWRAHLLDADGERIETVSGSGTTSAVDQFTTRLRDGQAYGVEVEVRDSTGLWGEPDRVNFTVEYPLPDAPEVEADWDPETGATQINLTNPTTEATVIEPVHNTVWRSEDGGDTWQLIADRVPLDAALIDPIPALGRVVQYRATAVTALPSEQDSEPVAVNTARGYWWVFINAGPGFIEYGRVRDNAAITTDFERGKQVHQFAGRQKPVEFAGEQRNRKVGLSARLAPESSTAAELTGLADMAAPLCLREPGGAKYFVSSGGLGISEKKVTAEINWEFTEIDYAEDQDPEPMEEEDE